MPQALAGLRVVELGKGPVTGIAGTILADFGAEVVRVESPRPDPLQELPAHPVWQRGKHQLKLDLSQRLDELHSLLDVADVFLTNLRPVTLKRRQLDYDCLHSRHPHLVYCHITGFGSRGPLANVPGYEQAVAAYSGRMLMYQGLVDRAGPVVAALQVGVHAVAQSAVAGILAAVYQQAAWHQGQDGAHSTQAISGQAISGQAVSGQAVSAQAGPGGRLVETSLLQGMLPYEIGAMIGLQFPDSFTELMPFMEPSAEPPLPSLYYHPAQAGDGRWMQMGNLLPHLFDNFLIATDLADVLADPEYNQVHNFRPGVPERLGIDYAAASAVNPGLVYLQVNGYGPDGPGAKRPSTHPVPGAALGGALYQLGEKLPDKLQDIDGLRRWTSRMMRANDLNPDPNTGLVVATAALLGLSARQRTGRGQQILVDMLGANTWANADDFVAWPGKPARALPDDNLLGFSPTQRLYECGDGNWVYLALGSDQEQTRFCKVMADEGFDLPDLQAASLAAMFRCRDAEAWQSLLVPAEIACLCASRHSPARFWLADEQVRAMGLTQPAQHPVLGQYLRPGSLVHFDGQSHSLDGPPQPDQHREEVLEIL